MASIEFDNVQRESITQKIVNKISETLLEKNVEPGDKLPSEKELREQFNVSRSTIRQALHVLVSMGIVASKPGKGYYVTEGYRVLLKSNNLQEILSKDDSFFKVLEARRIVGQNVAKLAAQRATQKHFEAMEAALDKLKDAENIDQQVRAARNVHLEIANSTNNDVLVGILEQLLVKIEEKARETQLDSLAAYESHKHLINKVRKGDMTELEEAVNDHSEELRTKFLSALKSNNA